MSSIRVRSFSRAARTTSNLPQEGGTTEASRAELVLLSSPGEAPSNLRRLLTDEPLQIGRDVKPTEFRIEDPSMSRFHARLVRRSASDAVELSDCDSRNGSFVNGRRVTSARLQDGDILRMGETLFVYMDQERMQRVHEQVQLSARAGLGVLLRGETGTGKELLARQIHERSGRSGRFLALNCASLPKEMILAELFGHKRGAFSGAVQRRAGLFLAAQGGTLLLDEIGDCSADVQVALLRALQERSIRPLGEEHEISIDVQVIAATHCNLEEAIRSGNFRGDLYARLAQSVIVLPPLRERKHQVLPLLRSFAQEFGCDTNVSPDAAEALLLWDYPFNIRELQTIARLFAVAHAPRGQLSLQYLEGAQPDLARTFTRRRQAHDQDGAAPAPSLPRSKRREELKALLDQHGGNVSKVALACGKPRAQIYRWLNANGLSAESFREKDSQTVARLAGEWRNED